jgi:hypothetical protein
MHSYKVIKMQKNFEQKYILKLTMAAHVYNPICPED